MRPWLLITCEHGGNHIPSAYEALFRGHGDVLNSHRGYDPGSLSLAQRFAKQLGAPLFSSTVTRLLIELNRSLGHSQVFSEFTRELNPLEKQRLIDDYYAPHRSRIVQWIKQHSRRNAVVHLSVHSFTPRLNGVTRRADVGLLYDPKRMWECGLCGRWQRDLLTQRNDLTVRRNYPYRGNADGLTTALRRMFPDGKYAGIELEVNQRWVQGDRQAWNRLQTSLTNTLRDVLSDSFEPR